MRYTNISDLYKQVQERKLTPNELEDREKIAKKLPMDDFKKRYGKDAMAVKMAVATNIAKGKSEEVDLDENYRVLATKGMGTESSKMAKLGQEVDYYEPKLGDKRFGKITKVSGTGYEITDYKTGKKFKFKFYDPKKAKKLMQSEEVVKEDGHQDVSSAIRQCKTITEDAMQIMSKLQGMNPEESLPTWWTNKLAIASNSMNKMRDYLLVPSMKEEHILKEAMGDLEDLKKVVAELENASKMHLAQSKRVQAHVDMMTKSEELDEAKYDLHHKDFSSAMQHAYAMAKKLHGITIDPKEIDDKVATGPKKPSKGKTNKYRLKGKGGTIQVQVANLDDKKFELNMYKEEVINEQPEHEIKVGD